MKYLFFKLSNLVDFQLPSFAGKKTWKNSELNGKRSVHIQSKYVFCYGIKIKPFFYLMVKFSCLAEIIYIIALYIVTVSQVQIVQDIFITLHRHCKHFFQELLLFHTDAFPDPIILCNTHYLLCHLVVMAFLVILLFCFYPFLINYSLVLDLAYFNLISSWDYNFGKDFSGSYC